MVAKAKQYLGNGLYTVAEAALYCRVSTAMMSRWLFGSKSGHSVIDPQFGTEVRSVSFLDLVQTIAIREIRLQRDLPLEKFRQAIKFAKDKYNLDYPFARQHCTYLYGDLLVIRSSLDREEYVEASGKHQGQRMFSFVEMYLENLSFGPEGLANKFRVFTSHQQKPVSVTMDPHTRFGEPLLPSGYSALTIWDAIQVEGGIEQAAKAYGIPKEETQAAYQFVVDYLGKTTA